MTLSRNLFFYKKVGLSDNFQTRVFLMFFHFSIILIIFKKKKSKFNQQDYDNLFHGIEYNLRELGFGDVSVNKKMKELNKILYDVLLKLEVSKKNNMSININLNLLENYFFNSNAQKINNLEEFGEYFVKFYEFCYEHSVNNVLEEVKNFKY